MTHKKPEISIGGVTLDPRAAASLRRIVANEFRFAKHRYEQLGRVLDLMDGGDDAAGWTDDGEPSDEAPRPAAPLA